MSKYDSNPLIKARFRSLGFESYYNKGHTGKNAILAIIDSFINEEHGTLMASIQPEIAKDVTLLKYDMPKGASYEIAQGIIKAVDDGAHIISISRGVQSDQKNVREAVKYAKSKGVLICASSGNDGEKYSDNISINQFPASYPEVLSVVCMDNTMMASNFSSHSINADVSTFGQNILMVNSSKDEILGTGTSPATIMVACALCLEVDRYIEVNGVKPSYEYMYDFAITNVYDLGEIGKDMFYGNGVFSLDMDILKDVMLELKDFNGNGLSDRLDEIKSLMLNGKTLEQAESIVNRKYYVIGHELIEGVKVPIYGGAKPSYSY